MKILDGLTLRSICGEYIVTGDGLSRIDFSKVVSMNATSAYLWEALKDRDFDVEDMVSLLTIRYEVEEERARADAQNLIGSWREAGLLAE